MPANFTVELDSAIPGNGINSFDYFTVKPVQHWTNPILIEGSYIGDLTFWEPMFLYTFVSGSEK
jgi:hypothetical protein